MIQRLKDCHRSFAALPVWVRLWVAALLVPLNALPFLLLDSPVGRAAALASLFVLLTNVPIMLIERGMSRLMSVPHLIAWLPLLAFLVAWLQDHPVAGNAPWLLAAALVLVNGLSLIFDAFDTWRWLRGERDVPGRAADLEAA